MTEIKNLIQGYRQFYQKYFTSEASLYRELTQKGQSPKTLVIACSDSRVDPSILLCAKPGDIFVVRNVANLVPPYVNGEKGVYEVSAALEFAVCTLKVCNIVILGHSHCAGIQTLLASNALESSGCVGEWVKIAESAKKCALEKQKQAKEKQSLQHICEKEGIIHSLKNLLTFPWIRLAVEKERLRLYGWYFGLSDGSLQQYCPETGQFERL